MNPWRKRRRQRLRRQNEGSYGAEMLRVSDIVTVTIGPLIGGGHVLLVDGVLIDFTKPMPRMFPVHDPSEFFGPEAT